LGFQIRKGKYFFHIYKYNLFLTKKQWVNRHLLYLLVEVIKMFYCGAPILTIIVCLIGAKLVDIHEKQKIKQLEKEMRKRGIDENTIFITTSWMKL